MAGCDMVFDNRGALKRHRTEAHPELEEFKPVDLEPDDPDRAAEMTVACPVCERKFKHKNTCTVHIKTNHLGWSKRKLFECPECQRPFDNKKAVEAGHTLSKRSPLKLEKAILKKLKKLKKAGVKLSVPLLKSIVKIGVTVDILFILSRLL